MSIKFDFTVKMKREEIISKSYIGIFIVFLTLGLQYSIGFVVQTVLARLLGPEVLGSFALIITVVMFFNTMASFHGDKYVIKEEDDIEDQLNSIFTFSLLVTFLVVIITVVIIPFLLSIWGQTEHTHMAQILTVLFFYNPLILPKVLYERKLKFVKSGYPLIVSQSVSGLVAVILAYQGFGLWSLLWWRISQLGLEVIIFWIISPWKAKFKLDRAVIKKSLKFGFPITLASIFVFISWNVDYYIVEYFLGSTQLGYYYLAFQISNYFLNVKTALNTVAFPMYSRLSSLEDRLKLMKYTCEIMGLIYLMPIIILMFWGEQLIVLVFGEIWLPSVPVFQVFSLVILMRAIGCTVGPLMYSIGMTMPLLKLSIIQVIVQVPLLLLGTSYAGINGAAMAVLLSAVVMVCYGFQKYIAPIASKTFFYYYSKPILLALLITFLGYSSRNMGINQTSSWLLVSLILALLYFSYKEILLKSCSPILKRIRLK